MKDDFVNIGGKTITEKYKGSPSLLLSQIYPSYDWLPWKFRGCPHFFWNNTQNQQKFMDWAGTQLNVKEMNDWYKVTEYVSVMRYSKLIE
jgi:hypothetical protein